ncbi:diaminopimelate epimerase [Rhodohalobacter halophilus]|uniref:diaminopimelate epimerase n=1 Tax=Rhodohalobacter halophilus TaxID=1812810 RepID=UPI0009FEA898|nr:diaminopimelate epimerase [Rhodohalobacter halophilus]
MNQNSLHFIKMQGAGNDFILIDNRTLKLSDDELSKIAPALCDRKFGIGSDGLIALCYDTSKKADLVMNYKNPDGSDAGMCGNGARCFAAYAVTLGSPRQFSFRVHDNVYRADVGEELVSIRFPLETEVKEEKVGSEAVLNVYTNTEHIVCPVQREQLEDEKQLITDGRYLRYHDYYQPGGTNVNFISGVESNELCLQTYERGVENLTLACGTGAIASAISWHYLQQAGNGEFDYSVKVRGGTLQVLFTYNSSNKLYSGIELKGPAVFVFEGQYYLH